MITKASVVSAKMKTIIIRWALGGAVAAVILSLVFAGYVMHKVALIGAGFYAKTLCSGVFVSKRKAGSVISEDIQADQTFLLSFFSGTIDHKAGLVTASLSGLGEQKALYRPGLGCTLVIDTSLDRLRAQAEGIISTSSRSELTELWPKGERVDLGESAFEFDKKRLKAAIDEAFFEPDPNKLRRTRAVVIVHKGKIIAERYAPGFGPNTPQLGWSMTKSVMNALAGILVGDGKLKVEAQNLFPEWWSVRDGRADISIDQLLRMSSGLVFDEAYDALMSDVHVMLFLKRDNAQFAAQKPLEKTPGEVFVYSSGTTNVISQIIRQRVEGSLATYLSFPRHRLFDRIGALSAVIEPDASGTLVGSAYMYASARDWARFGLLYLRDGVWNDERILPKDWVRYSTTPVGDARGKYGAHFWLKFPEDLKNETPLKHPLPRDGFYMFGHDGQMVAMIPSKDLVVVRLGLSRRAGAWQPETFLSNILSAFSKVQRESHLN